MTRVGSPSPGLVPATLTQGAPASAVIAELPPTLRNVGLGAFLSGTVLERAANGMIMLQTGSGVLGIKTTVPLPLGSTVTLQVQTAGAQLQAIVLSVTPQGAPSIRTATQGPATPSVIVPLQAPGQPPTAATVTAGTPAAAAGQAPMDGRSGAPSTITATVIGPSGGPVPAMSGAPTPQPAVASPPAPASPVLPGPAASPAPAAPPPASPAIAQTVLSPVPGAPGSVAYVPSAAQAAAYQRQFNAVPAPPGSPAPATLSGSAPPVIPTQPMPASAEAVSTTPMASEPAPAPLPSGTHIQLRLVSANAANPQTAPPPANAPANTPAAAGARQATTTQPGFASTALAATVVARTPAGQTILDTPVGRVLAILPRTAESAVPGARVYLELVAVERPVYAARPGLASGPSALAREWPGLKDVMRLLQDAPTQDGRADFERALPKPGPRMAQQVLSFLESTAQGGARAWLGDAVSRALMSLGGDKMMDRLDHDLRDMLSTQRPADGDWRMTIVPLLDGRDLRQIRFFERRKKRDEADRKRDDAARFVVECEHSELGALQLDGLMHEQRLDLIVRTHDPLPSDMERDILVLFGQACTGLNLNGQLFFQAVPSFPVSPLDDFSGGAVRVSV